MKKNGLALSGKLLLACMLILLFASGWGMYFVSRQQINALLALNQFQNKINVVTEKKDLPPVTADPATSIDAVRQATAKMRQQPFPDSIDNLSRTSEKHMILTVGIDSGDLQGGSDKVIQAGIDSLARMGGGTLQLLPGTYTIHNAIMLHSNVHLLGKGSETILKKAKGIEVPLVQDADWFETAVKVSDTSGFSPGDGVMIQARKPGTEGVAGLITTKAVITAIDQNLISLDRHLEKEYRAINSPRLTSAFPILTGEKLSDIRIEHLVLDGNKEENEFIDGNLSGAIFLKYSTRIQFSEVVAQNYNGDGFSVQACKDLSFERCTAQNNAKYGFHPGSGSTNTIFNQVTATGNAEGLFFCYGVNHTIVYKCICSNNRDYGISIGYRDTDNVLQECIIEKNGKIGVLFREANSDFEGAHRNIITQCRFMDNGSMEAEGVGIEIRERNHDLILSENDLINSPEGHQVRGIRIYPEALRTNLQGNRFTGPQQNIDATKPLKETLKTILGR